MVIREKKNTKNEEIIKFNEKKKDKNILKNVWKKRYIFYFKHLNYKQNTYIKIIKIYHINILQINEIK